MCCDNLRIAIVRDHFNCVQSSQYTPTGSDVERAMWINPKMGMYLLNRYGHHSDFGILMTSYETKHSTLFATAIGYCINPDVIFDMLKIMIGGNQLSLFRAGVYKAVSSLHMKHVMKLIYVSLSGDYHHELSCIYNRWNSLIKLTTAICMSMVDNDQWNCLGSTLVCRTIINTSGINWNQVMRHCIYSNKTNGISVMALYIICNDDMYTQAVMWCVDYGRVGMFYHIVQLFSHSCKLQLNNYSDHNMDRIGWIITHNITIVPPLVISAYKTGILERFALYPPPILSIITDYIF